MALVFVLLNLLISHGVTSLPRSCSYVTEIKIMSYENFGSDCYISERLLLAINGALPAIARALAKTQAMGISRIGKVIVKDDAG